MSNIRGAVVVAIPVLNEAAHIAETYRQLSLALPANRRVRFLIIDGGSTDGTREIVAKLAEQAKDSSVPVELVANVARYQSAAINLAASAMAPHEKYLVRADAHAGYPPDYVAMLIDTLEATGADSVVVPMDSVGDSCSGRAIAWVSDTRVGSGGSAHRGGSTSGPVTHGHHAAWRVASFRSVGGYDPSFSHNEDAEFDRRLRRAGGSIWLDANIRVTYFVRRSLASLFRQYRDYGRGCSRTTRRHGGITHPRQLLVIAFLPAIALALAAALTVRSGWILLAPYLAILAYTSLRIAVARRSFCGLLAGPAACVMHTAWSFGFLEGLVTVRERLWNGPDQPQVRDGSLASDT